MTTVRLPKAFLTAAQERLGPGGVIQDPDIIAPYLREWRGKYQGATPLLTRPQTTQDLAALIRLCATHGVAITPQSGNTGLVGGQIPFGDSVLVSLAGMDRIRAVDVDNNTITAEAGCILGDLQRAAEDVKRLFPLDLAAKESCRIGGCLSSNAGGINVLRYGTARDQVLGLEVVLPDGRVLNDLSGLYKDNTGYDLKQLFLGAEGTLGIITAATLKLYPRPRGRRTAFAAIPSVEAAVSLLRLAQDRCGDAVESFELIPRIGLDFVLRHTPGARDPLEAPSPWYVLCDVTGPDEASVEAMLTGAFEAALNSSLSTDVVVALSPAQAAALWAIREALSEAQKPEGGSIKHDVSVPVSHYAAFITEASAAMATACPGIRPVPFGHIGDGNVHFNLSQPVEMDRAAFLARWDELSACVHEIAARHGGSISAEHGIGVMKRDALRRFKDPVALDLMRTLKNALDPQGLMNPGKLL